MFPSTNESVAQLDVCSSSRLVENDFLATIHNILTDAGPSNVLSHKRMRLKTINTKSVDCTEETNSTKCQFLEKTKVQERFQK